MMVKAKCKICGEKEAWAPRGDEKYYEECWGKVSYRDKAEEANLSEVLMEEIENIVESWGGENCRLVMFEGTSVGEYSGEV